MTHQRALKIGRMIVVAALVAGLSLTFLTNIAAAQGPGGGRGPRGAGQGGAGQGVLGQGIGAQNRASMQAQMQADPALGGRQGGRQVGPLGSRYGAGGANRAGRGGFGLQAQDCLQNLPQAVPGEVPAGVVEAMTAGWLDESEAALTYQAIIDQFGAVRPFTNLLAARQQHMAAHEAMFARYGLDAPAPVAVETPAFASATDACAAALAVENASVGLYDGWLAAVADYPDLTQVFTNLRDASLSQHLPALERCAG